MTNDSIVFLAQTPLGFTVVLSDKRWQLIITQKHPALAGQSDVVKTTLEDPDEIRRSKSDQEVYLFYREVARKRWSCAVVKHRGDDSSFLITAYPTDAIKEGEVLWTR